MKNSRFAVMFVIIVALAIMFSACTAPTVKKFGYPETTKKTEVKTEVQTINTVTKKVATEPQPTMNQASVMQRGVRVSHLNEPSKPDYSYAGKWMSLEGRTWQKEIIVYNKADNDQIPQILFQYVESLRLPPEMPKFKYDTYYYKLVTEGIDYVTVKTTRTALVEETFTPAKNVVVTTVKKTTSIEDNSTVTISTDEYAKLKAAKKAAQIAATKAANEKWLKIIQEKFYYTGNCAVTDFQTDAAYDKIYKRRIDNDIGSETIKTINFYLPIIEKGLSDETANKWAVLKHALDNKPK